MTARCGDPFGGELPALVSGIADEFMGPLFEGDFGEGLTGRRSRRLGRCNLVPGFVAVGNGRGLVRMDETTWNVRCHP